MTERLHKQARHFLMLSRNQEIPEVRRAVSDAFVNSLRTRHREFLRAAFQNRDVQAAERGVEDVLIRTPARWEFEHIIVFGSIEDAYTVAGRYRVASKFVAVHPVQPTDPLAGRMVGYIHKQTSPWLKAFNRRMELKRQLGSYRSLVGKARKMTKENFIAHWRVSKGSRITINATVLDPQTRKRKADQFEQVKTMKDLSDDKLLSRTGYTPEQFWQEVRKPGSVPTHPHFNRIVEQLHFFHDTDTTPQTSAP